MVSNAGFFTLSAWLDQSLYILFKLTTALVSILIYLFIDKYCFILVHDKNSSRKGNNFSADKNEKYFSFVKIKIISM